MVRSLVVTLLLMGCSDNDCPKASFSPINVAAGCVEKTVVAAGCADVPGTDTTSCSVAEGKFYLSRDGRIYPGGRECTDAEIKAVGFNTLSGCP